MFKRKKCSKLLLFVKNTQGATYFLKSFIPRCGSKLIKTTFLTCVLKNKIQNNDFQVFISWDQSLEIRIIILDKKPGKAISIDHFDLIRVIGRGSYAKVLMVELKETRRLYAMKVIKKELVTDDEVCTYNYYFTTQKILFINYLICYTLL